MLNISKICAGCVVSPHTREMLGVSHLANEYTKWVLSLNSNNFMTSILTMTRVIFFLTIFVVLMPTSSTDFEKQKKNGTEFRSAETVLYKFERHSDISCNLCRGSKRKGQVDGNEPRDIMSLLMDMTSVDRIQCLSQVFNSVTKHEREEIAKVLGQSAAHDLKRDSGCSDMTDKDIATLEKFSPEIQLKKYSKCLIEFLTGLCTLKDVSLDKLSFQLCVICEQIYRLVRPKFVGTASFFHNLNLFAVSNSKSASNINGSLVPGGKYSTISNWLDQQATKPPICPPGDLVVMFDNEQIVGKTWSIKPHNKVEESIITNIAAVSLSEKTESQKQRDIHPRKWLSVQKNQETVARLCGGDPQGPEPSSCSEDFMKSVHYQQLHVFVDIAICDVLSKQEIDSHQVITDVIDDVVHDRQKQRMFRICPFENCQKEVPRCKRKCTHCGSSMAGVKSAPLSQHRGNASDNEIFQVEVIDHKAKAKVKPQAKLKTKLTEQYDHVPTFHSDKPH